MLKKLLKIFISKNISKFIVIIFCITLSLSAYLVSDNLVKNIQVLIWNEIKPIFWWDIKISSFDKLNDDQLSFLEGLEDDNKIVLSKKIQLYTTIIDKYKNPSLVSLIFIDNKYPLYWSLEIKKNSTDLWTYVSENVFELFVGLNNDVSIFEKKYNVSGIITKIPESWINLFDDWKKILLDFNEFDKLKIDKLWSRINRNYLIKVNNSDDFDNILNSIKDNKIFEFVRVNNYKKWWERFSQTFLELDKFIKYILIISFVLTILIIFLSVESFYIDNKKSFSLLKILWIRDRNLLLFNILLFFIIYWVSFFLSVIVSEFSFVFIRKFELSRLFTVSYLSILKTSILWLIIVTVSVVLPLLKFFSNNPLAWLKENFLQVYTRKEIFIELILIIVSSISIYILILWGFTGWVYFSLYFLLIVLFSSLIIKYFLKLLYKKSLFLKKDKFLIYDSIRNTVKPWNLSLLIVFWFIISFTSILFISIISLNFLDKLNVDLKDSNNLYIININDKDIDNIDKKYKESSYSILLWRILKINWIDIKEHKFNWNDDSVENNRTEGVSWRFTREFNITDNELIENLILKWRKIKSWEVSIDSDFSKSLNIDIWDSIQFYIYWKKKILKVANIRESQKNTITPFFYFQVYKDDFSLYPKTYFLTTYVPLVDIIKFKLDFLSKTGSHISFIEIDKIMDEVKSISTKVFIIIQILFIYIFIFCIISLIVCISFLIPFKKNKSRLYNILGANKDFISNNIFYEYLYLQTISLIISIILATVSTRFILNKSRVIDFTIPNYLLSISILILIYLSILFLIRLMLNDNDRKI